MPTTFISKIGTPHGVVLLTHSEASNWDLAVDAPRDSDIDPRLIKTLRDAYTAGFNAGNLFANHISDTQGD